MNKLYILIIILVLSLQPADAATTYWDNLVGDTITLGGKKLCSWCVEQGLKSTIEIRPGFCTAVFCGNGYYDEDGNYVSPSRCNTCTTHYECSQGHNWTEGY